ncbi:MAG TPA: 2-hydroxy-3-oxopropionate reductase [Cyclobacteriaceae bacterium]|nr:2-hydroxy-3-oxopropionate reductase [Cyclobacteriaceae bacterium]
MEKIGFIGLGIMGKPMAQHLIKAGHPVTILGSSASANELKSGGARVVNEISALVQQSDVVITMLPDSAEVEAAIFGNDGILSSGKRGLLFIDMSTIAPSTTTKIFKAFQEKGIDALDAPVSGGQAGAQAATLSIMIGGTETAVQRAMPIFNLLGKNIVHIGETGAGQIAKACNQVIVGMTIQAVAEALTLAKKANVDVAKVRAALLGGFAQSKILDLHGQRIIDKNFKPGFRIKLHRKDMNIALQTAKQLSVPLPGSAIVASQMDALIAMGDGELDHSSLALLLQKMSGLE